MSNPDSVKRPKCETVTCVDGGQWTGFEFDEACAYMDAQVRDIKALEDDNAKLLQGLADANCTNKRLFEQIAEQAETIKALEAENHRLDMDAETFKTRVDVLEAERDKWRNLYEACHRDGEWFLTERTALRHKVVKYGQAARHYRFTMRAARGAVHDMWKTQAGLATAEELLRRRVTEDDESETILCADGEPHSCECLLCIETRAFLNTQEADSEPK